MYWCVQCQTYNESAACPACHAAGVFSPALLPSERAEADDMVRVGRLPRPQYGDGHHRQLSNAVNRARAAAIDHLLAHWHTLLIVQRHLG